MTSEERRERRYERRKARRDAKKAAVSGVSFEDVFSFRNLWDAGKNCCLGVRWKTSTINFETTMLTQIEKLYNELHGDSYVFRGFKHFKTIEHGKERDINALVIQDRAIQKCYCDNVMTGAYSRTYIYDNSASLPEKGMDFTLKRLKKHLAKHFRLHGLNGGIYQYDFHGYFASIPRDTAKKRLSEHLDDSKLIEIGHRLIDDFDRMTGGFDSSKENCGVGLGSQVSQNIALDFASPLDHFIKDVLRVKGYARYMDDGYIISDSIDELKDIRNAVVAFAESLGIEINEKKNIITPFRDHSFTFLKMRITLTPSGKVVMKMSRKSIQAIRRKLYIFRKWVDEGRFSAEDVFMSYQSWRSHARRCSGYRTLRSMDELFVKLFAAELAEREKKFQCLLRARWNYEVGWIYYRSESEYRDILDGLRRTREERYRNGFIPMCKRADYIKMKTSKATKAFSLLQETRKK